MADTIINTPSRDDGAGALGWIVALIVIVAVIVAGFLWVRRGAPAPATPGSANINVTLPTGGGDGGGAQQ